MSFEYVRIEDGKVKKSTDDSRMRDIGIKFFEQAKGLKFENGTEKGIDLILSDNQIVGAEGENGKSWCGNRWTGHQSDLFKIGRNTLNLEHRKWHYWNLQELSGKYKAKIWWGKHNPGWNMNWYFRLNNQEDQLVLVPASSILDEKKRTILLDRQVRNSDEPEDWICIFQEYVETWNKQPNGLWVLDGQYYGPSKDECFEMWMEEKRLKEEQKNKRLQEISKQNKK